jgi:hypothetical protein
MPKPNPLELVANTPPFDGRLAGDLSWAVMRLRDVALDDDELSQADAERIYQLLISVTVGFNEVATKKLLVSPIFNENTGSLH